MTTAEIATDTEAIAAAAQQLNAAADELDAEAAALGAVPEQVTSQAAQFNKDHEPAGVYMQKVGELTTTMDGLKNYAAAQAVKLRSAAAALTAHAVRTDLTESENAQAMHEIQPDVGRR